MLREDEKQGIVKNKKDLKRLLLDYWAILHRHRVSSGISSYNGGVRTKVKKSPKGEPKNPNDKNYLTWAMGFKTPLSLNRWLLKDGVDGRSCPKISKGATRIGNPGVSQNVIDHRSYAKIRYSAKRMYVNAEIEALTNENCGSSSRADTEAATKAAGETWSTTVSKDPDLMLLWNNAAKNHDERQPWVKGIITDQLISQSCTSYCGLAAATDYWCSASTIERWLKSFDSYGIYRKEIKPGLTAANSKKQAAHSKKVVEESCGFIQTKNGSRRWFPGPMPSSVQNSALIKIRTPLTTKISSSR